jgi:hypothetical protein
MLPGIERREPMSPDTQIRSGDLINDEYEISYEGSTFVAKKSGSRIDFFHAGSNHPVGSIRLGSQWSGAVWMGNTVIGEFEQHGREWQVMPISAGRKNPDGLQRIHPASYLLASIIQIGVARA